MLDKKKPLILLFLILSIGLLTSLLPQSNSFEGSVTYKINYIELPDEVAGMESMLPQSTTMSLKGDKIRITQEVMGGSQVVVVDNKKKESHILMDMMGQKMAILISKEEMEASEANEKKPKIELEDDFKTILNYTCQKALITTEEGVQEVWFTDKIKAKLQNFEGLPGFPLEYVTNENNMKMRMTVSEISNEKLKDSMFEIPEGYEIMTQSELSKMMGGN